MKTNCPYRWYQFAWACVSVCALLGVSLCLTSCQVTHDTGKGTTITFRVSPEEAAGFAAHLGLSKKFGISGKEARRVLP
jgi:hypothetical protein